MAGSKTVLFLCFLAASTTVTVSQPASLSLEVSESASILEVSESASVLEVSESTSVLEVSESTSAVLEASESASPLPAPESASASLAGSSQVSPSTATGGDPIQDPTPMPSPLASDFTVEPTPMPAPASPISSPAAQPSPVPAQSPTGLTIIPLPSTPTLIEVNATFSSKYVYQVPILNINNDLTIRFTCDGTQSYTTYELLRYLISDAAPGAVCGIPKFEFRNCQDYAHSEACNVLLAGKFQVSATANGVITTTLSAAPVNTPASSSSGSNTGLLYLLFLLLLIPVILLLGFFLWRYSSIPETHTFAMSTSDDAYYVPPPTPFQKADTVVLDMSAIYAATGMATPQNRGSGIVYAPFPEMIMATPAGQRTMPTPAGQRFVPPTPTAQMALRTMPTPVGGMYYVQA